MTGHPSIHHHPFHYLPAWDDAMTRLVFVPHRTGRRACFASDRTGFAQVYEATVPENWFEILPGQTQGGSALSIL